MPTIESVTLLNGEMMPKLGFGVYLSPPEVCTQSCLKALDIGYRHIDTAQYYGNEKEVGRAVQQSGIPRSMLFLTTKILAAGPSFDESYRKCVESISNLDSDEKYVDLFLIHSPNCGESQRQTLWQVLERLHAEGKAKSIGVSNFGIQHIEGLKRTAKVWPPHVNQIEVNFLYVCSRNIWHNAKVVTAPSLASAKGDCVLLQQSWYHCSSILPLGKRPEI